MTELTCATGVPHLMDYLEGAVPPELAAGLERHVAGCAKCTAFVASYMATPDIVRRATLPMVPPMPADTRQALHDFLRKQLRNGT